MKFLLVIFASLFAFTFTLTSQTSSSIKAKIALEKSINKEEVSVQIIDAKNQMLIQKIKINKEDNTFYAYDVPFGTYIIEVKSKDAVLYNYYVEVESALPVNLDIKASNITKGSAIEITADKEAYKFNSTQSRYSVNEKQISMMPNYSSNKQIETILLSAPGVVPDEDGRLHVRGEDAQLQYMIDGIPVTANQTRIYSSLFNANVIKTADLITGGVDAEYGVATAGILNINTRSGFDKPLFANAYTQLGNFNNKEFGVGVGGNISEKAALFVTYANNASDRYLDPISEAGSIHNQGKNQNVFAKLDFLISEKIDLNILTSYGNTNYQVPNGETDSKQDQKQEITNFMMGFRLNAELSSSSVISVLGYTRADRAEITSNGLNRISSPQDSLMALQNEKFFMGGKRDNKTYGGMIELTTRLFDTDVFKAGAGGEMFPLKEYFTFAVTNPDVSDSTKSGGDSRYVPYDITKGGIPFLVDQSMTGKRYFAYLQDKMRYDNWTFSYGLRFDHYNIFEAENSLSARVAASYQYNEDITFRASYNGVTMMAPTENILVSGSAEASKLTGAEQIGIPTRVKSQKSHGIELGGRGKLNNYLTLDVAGYAKLIDDFIVKVEMGNSGVIFPANLKQGLVAGGEVQLKLNNWNNFSGFLNLSTCVSLGMIPEDGSAPISAGLILGEEGHNYKNPFKGEDMFPTEHNQIFTAVMNLSYNFHHNIFLTLGSRFDSGLPFDLVGADGKGLDAEQSRAELKKRGYSDKVIDMLSLEPEEEHKDSPDKSVAPHLTFDLGAGIDLRHNDLGFLPDLPVRLSLSVINVLDTDYLYKFESSFGGTHFGLPRMYSLKAEVYTF